MRQIPHRHILSFKMPQPVKSLLSEHEMQLPNAKRVRLSSEEVVSQTEQRIPTWRTLDYSNGVFLAPMVRIGTCKSTSISIVKRIT